MSASAPSSLYGVIDAVAAFDGFESRDVAQEASVAIDTIVSLRGWAAETSTPECAASVALVVDGSSERPARYGVARPDIVRHFDTSAVLRTGFLASVAAAELGPGRHELTLRVYGNDGEHHDLPSCRLDVVATPSRTALERFSTDRIVITTEPIDDEAGRASIAEADVLWRFRVAVLRGTARDERSAVACDEVRAVLDDGTVFPAIVGYPSGADGTERCGFKVMFPTDTLDAGTHSLRVIAIAADRSGFGSQDLRFTLRPFGTHARRAVPTDADAPHVEVEAFPARVVRGEPIFFRGHAFARAPHGDENDIGRTVLVLDDAFAVATHAGAERSELVARFDSESARYAGFVAAAATENLASGFHRIRAVTLANGASLYRSAVLASFEVIDPPL